MHDRLPQTIEVTDICILLIEDSPADARFLAEILKSSLTNQFKLVHVKRLAEAIAQLHPDRFDVALLDLTLPDSSG